MVGFPTKLPENRRSSSARSIRSTSTSPSRSATSTHRKGRPIRRSSARGSSSTATKILGSGTVRRRHLPDAAQQLRRPGGATDGSPRRLAGRRIRRSQLHNAVRRRRLRQTCPSNRRSTRPSTARPTRPIRRRSTSASPSIPTKPIANSYLKVATVTLPEGAGINPSLANGLETCSNAQFAYHTNDPIQCPAASEIGTVDVRNALPAARTRCTARSTSPNPKATSPRSGKQFRIFLTVESERYGVNVRLKGQVFPNLQTGQLTVVVEENPQATFSCIHRSTSPAAPRGALTTPNTCGPNKTTSASDAVVGKRRRPPERRVHPHRLAGRRPLSENARRSSVQPDLQSRADTGPRRAPSARSTST